MRTHSVIAPTFWTRGSGKRIRGDKNAQLVALYLMSSPHTSMIGIFHLALPTLCHETGLSETEARAGLLRCEQEQLAFWDEADELVLVPELAHYQVGETLKVNEKGKPDHRRAGVMKALNAYRKHRFYWLFIERYGVSYGLTDKPLPSPFQAPPKGHETGSEAPSKPLEMNLEGPPSPYDPDPDPISDPVDLDQPVRPDQSTEVKPIAAPPAVLPKPPTPNPMDDQFNRRSPEQRSDVAQVHDLFKQTIGKPHMKFRSPWDQGARDIAAAIDTDGLEAALTVARHCMFDGMVNGKLDDKRQKHDSPEYVFGKSHVFHRILEAALKAGKGPEAKKRLSPSEAVAAAKALPVNR